MNELTVTLSGIAKEFNGRSIFRDISFALEACGSLAITGRNGSGKSTLVKIVCGLLSPSRGMISYAKNGATIPNDQMRKHIGFVSPYLQLYDEFSGVENLEILSTIRADRATEADRIQTLLRDVGLWERRNDLVRTYSSGMKQRLKYAFAAMHRPALLVLDEPTSNLDAEGIEMVKTMVTAQKRSSMLIVATNDASEAAWCEKRMELGGART